MFVAESLAKSARVASSCKTGHSEVESNHGRVTGECSGDCPKGKLIGCAFLVSIAEAVAVLIFRTESGCFGIVHAVLHRWQRPQIRKYSLQIVIAKVAVERVRHGAVARARAPKNVIHVT